MQQQQQQLQQQTDVSTRPAREAVETSERDRTTTVQSALNHGAAKTAERETVLERIQEMDSKTRAKAADLDERRSVLEAMRAEMLARVAAKSQLMDGLKAIEQAHEEQCDLNELSRAGDAVAHALASYRGRFAPAGDVGLEVARVRALLRGIDEAGWDTLRAGHVQAAEVLSTQLEAFSRGDVPAEELALQLRDVAATGPDDGLDAVAFVDTAATLHDGFASVDDFAAITAVEAATADSDAPIDAATLQKAQELATAAVDKHGPGDAAAGALFDAYRSACTDAEDATTAAKAAASDLQRAKDDAAAKEDLQEQATKELAGTEETKAERSKELSTATGRLQEAEARRTNLSAKVKELATERASLQSQQTDANKATEAVSQELADLRKTLANIGTAAEDLEREHSAAAAAIEQNMAQTLQATTAANAEATAADAVTQECNAALAAMSARVSELCGIAAGDASLPDGSEPTPENQSRWIIETLPGHIQLIQTEHDASADDDAASTVSTTDLDGHDAYQPVVQVLKAAEAAVAAIANARHEVGEAARQQIADIAERHAAVRAELADVGLA